MVKKHYVTSKRLSGAVSAILLYSLLTAGTVSDALCGPRARDGLRARNAPSPKEEVNLGEIPFKILFETYRQTDGRYNWELFQMDADGSNAINLTRTPDLDEMYPHASPDGTKISFVVDEGTGRRKTRSAVRTSGPAFPDYGWRKSWGWFQRR